MGVIRTATFEDLEDLQRLYSYLGDEVTDSFKAREIFDKIKQHKGYKIYLYQDGERVLATASLIIIPNLAHGGRAIAVVENMVVEPEYRNRGIGTTLFRYIMDQAKQEGCYKLMLSSNLSREGAHRFYERVGLKKHGYSFMVDFRQ